MIDNYGPYPDEMFEEAERREKLNADKNERIDYAVKELAYIIQGGQNMKEYAQSVAFIMDVLESLKDD